MAGDLAAAELGPTACVAGDRCSGGALGPVSVVEWHKRIFDWVLLHSE